MMLTDLHDALDLAKKIEILQGDLSRTDFLAILIAATAMIVRKTYASYEKDLTRQDVNFIGEQFKGLLNELGAVKNGRNNH